MIRSGKKIDYELIKSMIVGVPNRSHRALLAFCFAFGCRAGELAKEYKHKYVSGDEEVSVGAKFNDVHFEVDAEGDKLITFKKPNFKQKQIKRNTNEGLLFCKKEVWLSEIITNWVSLTDTGSVRTNLGECLFPWKVARVKSIITKYTKPLGITPHDLRHSRASYFGVLSGNPYLVKELLGHASLETSKAYVHLGQSEIKRLIGG